MSNPSNQMAVKQFFNSDAIKNKFNELLGAKSQGFITSVLQIIQSSDLLQKADTNSLFNAAATAATLDLPIQKDLGYAYIVPYKGQAQFQIGWRGLVQLAQRSGQYKAMNVIEVYANQFKSFNTLTEELEADFSKNGTGDIVGYCAYFSLLNGFQKTSYWSKEKVTAHAMKYSQAYKSERGVTPWKDKDQFHEMAKKTVLKNTISKWGPMSIEMQKAVIFDQGVVEDIDHMEVTYPDNKALEPDHELNRVKFMIEEATNLVDFEKMILTVGEDLQETLSFEIAEKREILKNNA